MISPNRQGGKGIRHHPLPRKGKQATLAPMLHADISQSLSVVAVAAVPALLGIILHEVAHGWAAFRCGDPTARMLGRLTLNPLPHIDPLGLATFVLTSLTGFVFGWAKPVPVDPRYFRHPARDMMLVALAGPLTNFLLAAAFGLLLLATVTFLPPQEWRHMPTYMFALNAMQAGVIINFGLGWLNLVPIPPLDGSKVAAYFLPRHWALRYLSVERYGFLILLALLFTGLLGRVLGPLVSGSAAGLLALLGLY